MGSPVEATRSSDAIRKRHGLWTRRQLARPIIVVAECPAGKRADVQSAGRRGIAGHDGHDKGVKVREEVEPVREVPDHFELIVRDERIPKDGETANARLVGGTIEQLLLHRRIHNGDMPARGARRLE